MERQYNEVSTKICMPCSTKMLVIVTYKFITMGHGKNIFIYMYVCMYKCIYMYICMCVCVCVCVRARVIKCC
mgnify:CR=1 FL=1